MAQVLTIFVDHLLTIFLNGPLTKIFLNQGFNPPCNQSVEPVDVSAMRRTLDSIIDTGKISV